MADKETEQIIYLGIGAKNTRRTDESGKEGKANQLFSTTDDIKIINQKLLAQNNYLNITL